MFAVVKTGGKQYKVSQGDQIAVEKIAADAGAKVTLDEVLAIGGDKPQVGAPTVSGATVTAEVVEQTKGDKVIVFKKKRRHNYRRKLGHRQLHTLLKITDISVGGKSAAKPAEKKEEKAAEAKAAPKKTEAKAPAKKAPAKKTTAANKTTAKKTTEKKAAPKKTAAKKADKE